MVGTPVRAGGQLGIPRTKSLTDEDALAVGIAARLYAAVDAVLVGILDTVPAFRRPPEDVVETESEVVLKPVGTRIETVDLGAEKIRSEIGETVVRSNRPRRVTERAAHEMIPGRGVRLGAAQTGVAGVEVGATLTLPSRPTETRATTQWWVRFRNRHGTKGWEVILVQVQIAGFSPVAALVIDTARSATVLRSIRSIM